MRWIVFSVICLCIGIAFGHHTYFVSKRNIEVGGPIILGDADDLYYFTKACADCELTMSYAPDYCFNDDNDNEWKSVDLTFANKTYPAFVVYIEKIRTKEGEKYIYGMVMAVNGNLLQYMPNHSPPVWQPLVDKDHTNRLIFEGSGTSYGNGRWYSPSKPKKLYYSPGVWDFASADDNFGGLTDNVQDVELFSLVDKDKKSQFYQKWILMILAEHGLIQYYIGEIRNSKFKKLAGPYEFLKAENINDFSVTDRDPLTIFFNTYLRRSTKYEQGKWNAVIPQRKQVQLYQVKPDDYRLNVRFNFDADICSNKFIKKHITDLSTGDVLNKFQSINFYIQVLFNITPTATTEIGLKLRSMNPQTSEGATVGVNFVTKEYYYDKGSNYGTPQLQEYCENGCPSTEKVPITYDLTGVTKLRLAALCDGPIIDAYFFGNFFFTFFHFGEHHNNKLSVFSKGPASADVELYIYDDPTLKQSPPESVPGMPEHVHN